MSEPLVSVKMLTYNHAPYIAQAIEGVLMQKTTFPFELVIGEDCSTDGTREIVFDYAKRYPDIIRVVTSEQNVGAKKNSARVNEVLRGKYIAWCEGDDYWHRDDKLQIQVDYLEKNLDYGVVCSDFDQYYVNTGKLIKDYLRTTKSNLSACPTINDILSNRAGILTCTVLARRDLVEKVIASDDHLFKSDYFKMGDTQLWAEFSMVCKIHRLSETLATYQILEESATQSRSPEKKLEFLISNAEMCIYLCEKYKLPDAIRLPHESCFRRRCLRLAFLKKSPQLAQSVLEKYKTLSLKEWVWYWGATNSTLRWPVLLFLKVFMNNRYV